MVCDRALVGTKPEGNDPFLGGRSMIEPEASMIMLCKLPHSVIMRILENQEKEEEE